MSHERIVRAGKHLLELTDDILNLSKIEAGRIELDMRSIDIAELSNEVEMTVHPLAEQKGNEFEISYDVAVGAVQGDLLRVRQATSTW